MYDNLLVKSADEQRRGRCRTSHVAFIQITRRSLTLRFSRLKRIRFKGQKQPSPRFHASRHVTQIGVATAAAITKKDQFGIDGGRVDGLASGNAAVAGEAKGKLRRPLSLASNGTVNKSIHSQQQQQSWRPTVVTAAEAAAISLEKPKVFGHGRHHFCQ